MPLGFIGSDFVCLPLGTRNRDIHAWLSSLITETTVRRCGALQESPLAGLLDPAQREAAADVINASLLAHATSSSSEASATEPKPQVTHQLFIHWNLVCTTTRIYMDLLALVGCPVCLPSFITSFGHLCLAASAGALAASCYLLG